MREIVSSNDIDKPDTSYTSCTTINDGKANAAN